MYSVSVIIPTLQEAARIGALIERLRQANPTPFEIIVADAHSSDGTAQRARDLGAEVVLCNRSCRAVQMTPARSSPKGGHCISYTPILYRRPIIFSASRPHWKQASSWAASAIGLTGIIGCCA